MGATGTWWSGLNREVISLKSLKKVHGGVTLKEVVSLESLK